MTDAGSPSLSRGFTLIELVVFIVIVGCSLAGILSVMNSVARSSADPGVRKQSMAAAESLLEEILLTEYSNPADGYTGAERSQFDDVTDFAGYGTTSGLVDASGVPITGLIGYNFAPPTTVVSSLDLAGIAAFKITVSVTGPEGAVRIAGYRSRY